MMYELPVEAKDELKENFGVELGSAYNHFFSDEIVQRELDSPEETYTGLIEGRQLDMELVGFLNSLAEEAQADLPERVRKAVSVMRDYFEESGERDRLRTAGVGVMHIGSTVYGDPNKLDGDLLLGSHNSQNLPDVREQVRMEEEMRPIWEQKELGRGRTLAYPHFASVGLSEFDYVPAKITSDPYGFYLDQQELCAVLVALPLFPVDESEIREFQTKARAIIEGDPLLGVLANEAYRDCRDIRVSRRTRGY
jgi:hypothetical protein